MRTAKLIIVTGLLALGIGTAGSATAEEAAPEQPAAASSSAESAFGASSGGSQSIDQLLADLRSPDPNTRVAAIRALGQRREQAAVQPLMGLLRSDPLPEVRGWAVRALHDIGAPEGRAAIVTAAREDPDERVRAMAARLEGVTPAQPAPPPPARPVTQPAYAAPAYAPPPPPRPQRVRVPGRGLRLSGIITTSVTYGMALIIGLSLLSVDDTEWDDATTEHQWGWKLLLPVVGPAVAASTEDAEGAEVVLWMWTAAQILGITLMSVGFAQRARWRREHESDEDDQPAPAEARRAGIALVSPPGGLSLAGWFF